MEWPLSTWRSRLHCGNAAHGVQDPRLREDDGVLGKVSRVDKRLRDSWNGNRLSESMRGVKTPRRSRGCVGWEFELHDGISIICLIPSSIPATSWTEFEQCGCVPANRAKTVAVCRLVCGKILITLFSTSMEQSTPGMSMKMDELRVKNKPWKTSKIQALVN